jgi:hypothetical protein
MKDFGLWIYDTYKYVFDHNVNPLRRSKQIPPVEDRRCKWDLEREG